MKVLDIDGHPLPAERQRDWAHADSMGLRPSRIRFLNGEPFAVYKDGSGIYGPCPEAPEQPLTQKDMAEAAKQRRPDYNRLSPQEQWDEDKRLGILDWDGTDGR